MTYGFRIHEMQFMIALCEEQSKTLLKSSENLCQSNLSKDESKLVKLINTSMSKSVMTHLKANDI